MKKQIQRFLVIGNILVLLVCLTVFMTSSLHVLSRALYDYDQRTTMKHEPHEDIIVIEIDQESLDLLGTFPWPRDLYIPLLEQISGAKVIAFDIMFTTKSEDPSVDKDFADALAKLDNVIIPSFAEMESFFRKETRVKKDEWLKGQALYRSIPEISSVSKTAHINAALDEDGAIRRTWLMLDTPEGPIPSLAYKIAEMHGAEVSHYLTDNPQAELSIKFNQTTKDFMSIPFYMVVSGEVPPETFQDRIVLIGMAAAGSDAHPTPVDSNMYLVYAHANIVDQLLRNENISFGSDLLVICLIIAALSCSLWFTWRLRPIIGVLLVSFSSALMWSGQWYLFAKHSFYLDVMYPLAALWLGYLLNLATKTYFETKQKHFITRQFGRYLSPELVKEIANSDVELPLGGVNREISILFLDIRGFTPLSEKLAPEEIVDFLNRMFDMITIKVLANKGTIDKFIGDAAMVLFNAPLDVPHHEYRAVKTAFDIQQGMQDVQAFIREKHDVEVSIGIGINTGQVVVGNIGSYLRVDYTAIGDAVNTAARIESVSAANQILVSEETYLRTKEYFRFKEIGEKKVKGKSSAIRLYEVLDWIVAPTDRKNSGKAEKI
ncbi:adenylate/guanylate cyclase domain-containing protein [Brevibacillus ruminantium]|uniref:Adenylate/guanylate cyclase domain-containing protein n=1 Tax=Brevibacillus ruminantium TaxID=2950604 RepID=A0ABY4W896_9BACL|nr:adenylate/guanylate cyclase domain-containing protein [Brevibacillus ruminantium]USG63288.1 adenylate/guanylate cyclase domain-containing protein [Brevibacillus ruminantium]